MKTKTYSVQGVFSPIRLVIKNEITVEKRGQVYCVNRQEAANILKIAKRERSAKLIDIAQ